MRRPSAVAGLAVGGTGGGKTSASRVFGAALAAGRKDKEAGQ